MMKAYKNRHNIWVKIIAMVLVCLFLVNDVAWAQDLVHSTLKSSTLGPLVGNPQVYSAMRQMMMEKEAAHQEPIDSVIKRYAKNKKAKDLFDSSDLEELRKEFLTCIVACGANNTLSRLKTTLASTGGQIQVIFVKSEDELPVFEGKRVWGHAGTYVTVFALENEKDTKEGRGKIVGRLFHEIRARSTRAKKLFDEAFDIEKPYADEQRNAFVTSMEEIFENDNLRIQDQIEQSNSIADPLLKQEFANLIFAIHPDVMNRDYMKADITRCPEQAGTIERDCPLTQESVTFFGFRYDGIEGYTNYLEGLGIKLSRLKMRISDSRLELIGDYLLKGVTYRDRSLHAIRLDDNMKPVDLPADRFQDRAALLYSLFWQGVPLAVNIDTSGTSSFGRHCCYQYNTYFKHTGIDPQKIKITKQRLAPDKFALQIREAGIGLTMGKVLDEISVNEKFLPAGIKPAKEVTRANYWDVLVEQGKASLDRNPEIRFAYADTPYVEIDAVKYTGLSQYFSYLQETGLDNLQAIKFVRTSRKIEVLAVLKVKDKTTEEKLVGALTLDEDGYPVNTSLNRQAKRKSILLLSALEQQGNAIELVIRQYPGDKSHCFTLAGLNYRVDSFLEHFQLEAREIRVVEFAGTASPCRIEIRKREGRDLKPGELLAAIPVDRYGYPLALPKNKVRCSLLYLTFFPEKLRDASELRRIILWPGKPSFYSRSVYYRCLSSYFAYLEHIGIKDVAMVIARETPDSIELFAQIKTPQGAEEKFLHRVQLDGKKRPLCMPQDNSAHITLLKILSLQGAIDKDEYRNFVSATMYPTLGEAQAELAARAQREGGQANNTALVLKRKKSEGGDASLLRACRRLGIPLPKYEREWKVDPLAGYLSEVNTVKLPTEEEIAVLWGKRDAYLIDRLRPLVVSVIEGDLHLQMHSQGRQAELIDELIAEGNLIIAQKVPEWDGQGSLIAILRKELVDGLKEAKKAYSRQKHKWQTSLNETLESDKSRATQRGEIFSDKRERTPLDNAALLSERSPFGIGARIDNRDRASGLPIIMGAQKHQLVAALRELFISRRVFKVFENGSDKRWAVFIVGSLGNLGTAIRNSCDLNILILSNLDNDKIAECMTDLARQTGGVLEIGNRKIPTLLIGRNGDSTTQIIQMRSGKANELLTDFTSVLISYSVGSPARGFATFEAVSVNSYEHPDFDPQINVEPSHMRALVHTGQEEYSFEACNNGVLVTESSPGAAEELTQELRTKVSLIGEERRTDMRLAVMERFLNKQRKHLKDASPARGATKEELAAFEKEWETSELNADQFLSAASTILGLEVVLDRDKPIFVFSEKVTFDNNLVKCLPKLAEKGIKVAVIARTSEERALIDKLNEGIKAKDKKILKGDTIEDVKEAATQAHVSDPRFYYFRMEGSVDLILEGRNITPFDLTPDMVKKIIDAIGTACRIPPEKLPLLHEMARKFAEAA